MKPVDRFLVVGFNLCVIAGIGVFLWFVADPLSAAHDVTSWPIGVQALTGVAATVASLVLFRVAVKSLLDALK